MRHAAARGVATVVLLALLVWAHKPLVSGVLPLYRAAIDVWSPTLALVELRVVDEGADARLQASFVRAGAVRLADGRVIPPDGRGRAVSAVSSAKALILPGCLLAVLLLWRVDDRREVAPRAVLGLLALVPLLALDLPLVLVGNLWDSVQATLPALPTHAVQWGGRFMEGGGRMALAFAVGAGIVSAARWIADGQR